MNDEKLIWEAYENSKGWDNYLKLTDSLSSLSIDGLSEYLGELDNKLREDSRVVEKDINRFYVKQGSDPQRWEELTEPTEEEVNGYLVRRFGISLGELKGLEDMVNRDEEHFGHVNIQDMLDNLYMVVNYYINRRILDRY